MRGTRVAGNRTQQPSPIAVAFRRERAGKDGNEKTQRTPSDTGVQYLWNSSAEETVEVVRNHEDGTGRSVWQPTAEANVIRRRWEWTRGRYIGRGVKRVNLKRGGVARRPARWEDSEDEMKARWVRNCSARTRKVSMPKGLKVEPEMVKDEGAVAKAKRATKGWKRRKPGPRMPINVMRATLDSFGRRPEST